MDAPLTIDQCKLSIDIYIDKLMAERSTAATVIGDRYARFWQKIHTTTVPGGKRLRPYLTMIGYGSIDKRIVPIAAAQELIHMAMLVHDDVIDQDIMRHGQKNINGMYEDEYAVYTDHTRTRHYANSAAILAGDALLSEAYYAIITSDFDDTIKQHIQRQLFTSIYEVIGGELIDVEAAFVHDAEFDPLTVYRYKTAGYSFVGPLISGVRCNDADQTTIDCVTRYAISAGIAFQIQDDILGTFGNDQTIGKSTLSDLREAKRTLLVILHERLAKDKAAERFSSFGKNVLSDDDLLIIKQDMHDSGTKQAAEASADTYFNEAYAALKSLDDPLLRQRLEAFTLQLQQRKH